MYWHTENISSLPARLIRGQRGISLLEVLFSVIIIGIVVVGFVATLGTAVTTTEVVTDTNALAAFAFSEIEELRLLDFNEVPFSLSDDAGSLKEVPNYFRNIMSDLTDDAFYARGDLAGYPRTAAGDGMRSDESTLKWVAEHNLLTDGVSEGPDASGPFNEGEGPGGSGGGSGPGAGGPDDLPLGYQFWMVDLGQQYKISRVIYDNRFNVYESFGLGLDSRIHQDDVWQNEWRFFFRESELALGESFNPKYMGDTLKHYWGGGYGSTGVNVVFDNVENPLYAGILGVTEIDTYCDFDKDFHWPYVNEVEVYGFDYATEYVTTYTDVNGVTSYDNVIMYIPNYMNKGFDMARRCYVPADVKNFDPTERIDLFRVQLEFYTYDRRRNTEEWMRTKWWQGDDSELSRFTTSFYRDKDVRRDNLPLLLDLPEHTIYADNEDFFIEYTVPGATEIRLFFSIFDLQADVSGDYVQFFDTSGIQYGEIAYYGRPGDVFNIQNDFSPWVPGDTIVIHFHSDGEFNSAAPELYHGFKAARAEIHKPELIY